MTPTKTLEETVDLMLSSDPDDQLKAEYYQLENRFIAMTEMILKWDLGKLDPPPSGDRYVYANVLGTMRNYLEALKVEAKARDIEL